MFEIIQAAHVAGGALGLLALPAPLLARKGGRAHRAAGRVFVVAMVVASASAITLAGLRVAAGERVDASVFLGFVGLLTLTAALHGRRVLALRGRPGPQPPVDHLLPGLLALASIALALASGGDPLRLTFAGLGLFFAVPALRRLRAVDPPPRWWWFEHMRAMLFAAIAAVTAFLVVNWTHAPAPLQRSIPAPVVWIAPGVLGGIGLARWLAYYRRRFAGEGRG